MSLQLSCPDSNLVYWNVHFHIEDTATLGLYAHRVRLLGDSAETDATSPADGGEEYYLTRSLWRKSFVGLC